MTQGYVHGAATFDEGVRDLHRTAEPDGVFCYTFFKGSDASRERPDPVWPA